MATIVKGLYAGTFDPPTNGHLDLIRRSLTFCDKLIVAIGVNPAKKTLFSESERIRMLNSILESPEFDKVIVTSFDGLLVNYARDINANLLIRGIRSVSDFEYEINLAGVNKTLYPQIETAFLPTDPTLSVVSSSMVKEIAKHGGDISKFVSAATAEMVFKKLKSLPK
jgi:pantetheine-phosphate adenylyltransferase